MPSPELGRWLRFGIVLALAWWVTRYPRRPSAPERWLLRLQDWVVRQQAEEEIRRALR